MRARWVALRGCDRPDPETTFTKFAASVIIVATLGRYSRSHRTDEVESNMKRTLLALLGIALVPAAAAAHDQGWAAKFFPAGLTHNFGPIAYGSQQTHKFTITNIYNVPFQVSEARVSCGCVDARRPSIIIPPRGTAELEAVMNT